MSKQVKQVKGDMIKFLRKWVEEDIRIVSLYRDSVIEILDDIKALEERIQELEKE